MSAALERRPPSRMTVDEFLAWNSEEWGDLKWQLIDGEPVAMAPTRFSHGSLQSELARVLGNHLASTGRRCIVATEPGVVPRVRAHDNYRVPDLGVTCGPASDDAMIPAPILLAEIMSPNNRAVTRANVWSYTTIPAVQEILVLQSTRIEAELLRRLPDGSWPAAPEMITASGTLDLRCIGFQAPLASLYRTTYLAV